MSQSQIDPSFVPAEFVVIQGARGVLNDTPSAKPGDDSPAIADSQPEVAPRFQTIAKSIEDVAIAELREFPFIPDFLNPTLAERPIVYRTPEGLFHVEGRELIEEARAAGRSMISAEVETLAEHSDEIIAMHKAACRSATRGGHGEYMELARNTRICYSMLLASRDDLRVYGHGGRRFREGFTDNRQDDARHILSRYLGKDRATINTHLSHTEHLDDEAIAFFIQNRAPKAFFDEQRVYKRSLVAKLVQEGSDAAGISGGASFKLRERFAKWSRTKKATRGDRATGARASSVSTSSDSMQDAFSGRFDSGSTESTSNVCSGVGLATNSTPENEISYLPVEDTLEDAILDAFLGLTDIKAGGLGVSMRLAAQMSADPSLEDLKYCLEAEIHNLQQLLLQTVSLMAR